MAVKNPEIRERLAQKLYENFVVFLRPTTGGGYFIFFFQLYFVLKYTDDPWVFEWFAPYFVVLTITIVNSFIIHKITSKRHLGLLILAGGLLFTGFLFGALIVYYYRMLPIDFIYLTVMMLAALIAGAASVFAYYPSMYYTWSFGLSGPSIVYFFFYRPEESFQFLAILNIVYIVAMGIFNYYDHRHRVNFILLTFRLDKAHENVKQAHQQLVEKDQIMQAELDLAADIQQSILPDNLDPWREIEIASIYIPMKKVSGDFFEIIRHEKCVYLFQADISGHGIPAAFVTMAVKQLLTTLADEVRTPAEIFTIANQRLALSITTQDFLTGFLVRIDENYRLTYCNASHHPPFYYHAGDKSWSTLDTKGFMIGALAQGAEYEDGSLDFGPGDRLHIFSDGFLEQRNAARIVYGEQRLRSIIHEGVSDPLPTLHASLIRDFKGFQGAAAQEDDLSMLSFRRKQSAKS